MAGCLTNLVAKSLQSSYVPETLYRHENNLLSIHAYRKLSGFLAQKGCKETSINAKGLKLIDLAQLQDEEMERKELEVMDKRMERERRRNFGSHLTPVDIFEDYIYPSISDKLFDYAWTDNFCGEGNLILPMLEHVDEAHRIQFFEDHVFLSDVSEDAVMRSQEKAAGYGIPTEIAEKNISINDGLRAFPKFKTKFRVFHVTNPPYLYLGYIAKTAAVRPYLRYFTGSASRLQDLYQIALLRDFEKGLDKMVYIIPSNFLYGNSVSNEIRKLLFSKYRLEKATVIEKRVFQFTGTNVAICFFAKASRNAQKFTLPVTTVGSSNSESIITLDRRNNYRAGLFFDDLLSSLPKNDLKFEFYLAESDLLASPGTFKTTVVDVSHFSSRRYGIREYMINGDTMSMIRRNMLFLRTLDSGSKEGRCGLYNIREEFNAEAIVVSGKRYRTHPIQILFESLPAEEQEYLRIYFNKTLEYMRSRSNSEFLTTYKYSSSNYTRKYLGLNQARSIIRTYPIFLEMDKNAAFHEALVLADNSGMGKLFRERMSQ
ncbi:MAG: N-6 DNA methylase [Thermoplasmataceae archaeon]